VAKNNSTSNSRLYGVCYDKEDSVERYASNGWQFGCSRMLGPMEITEWNELQVLLGEVRMSSEEDEISWGLSELKVFTTNSLYKFLTTGGIRSSLACKI
jgi:hypothetical protein